MEVTVRLLHSRGENAGYGSISALQGREPKLGWCVDVLQWINQLLGGGIARVPLRGAPGLQQCGNAGLLARIVGWLGWSAPTATDQIVDQSQAVALRDRQNLVHAIGVEGGEGGLRRVVAAQVEPSLAVLVAHDQLAPCEGGRQR